MNIRPRWRGKLARSPSAARKPSNASRRCVVEGRCRRPGRWTLDAPAFGSRDQLWSETGSQRWWQSPATSGLGPPSHYKLSRQTRIRLQQQPDHIASRYRRKSETLPADEFCVGLVTHNVMPALASQTLVGSPKPTPFNGFPYTLAFVVLSDYAS